MADGTFLFAGGGASHTHASHACDVYNPQRREWTRVGSLREARYYHSATRLADGRVIVVGGTSSHSNASGTKASTELFDPRTRQWTPGPELREARCQHVASLLHDGRLIVAGGDSGAWRGSKVLTSTEILDSSATKWSTGSLMWRGRTGAASVDGSSNRPPMIVGGVDQFFEYRGEVEVFDIHGEQWLPWGRTTSPEDKRKTAFDARRGLHIIPNQMKTARGSHAAVRLDSGGILVTGGGDRSGVLKSCEILFVPPMDQWLTQYAKEPPEPGP